MEYLLNTHLCKTAGHFNVRNIFHYIRSLTSVIEHAGEGARYSFMSLAYLLVVVFGFIAAPDMCAASTEVFAVNAGGGQYTDTTGNVYHADTDYSGGAAASTTAAISGTVDNTLYQTERYGNFSYNIPLTNGNYNVTLKFAEIYWNAAGERIFNVSMQGTQVISNLDITLRLVKMQPMM